MTFFYPRTTGSMRSISCFIPVLHRTITNLMSMLMLMLMLMLNVLRCARDNWQGGPSVRGILNSNRSESSDEPFIVLTHITPSSFSTILLESRRHLHRPVLSMALSCRAHTGIRSCSINWWRLSRLSSPCTPHARGIFEIITRKWEICRHLIVGDERGQFKYR